MVVVGGFCMEDSGFWLVKRERSLGPCDANGLGEGVHAPGAILDFERHRVDARRGIAVGRPERCAVEDSVAFEIPGVLEGWRPS